jgi:hypothetical protein
MSEILDELQEYLDNPLTVMSPLFVRRIMSEIKVLTADNERLDLTRSIISNYKEKAIAERDRARADSKMHRAKVQRLTGLLEQARKFIWDTDLVEEIDSELKNESFSLDA